MPKLVIIRGIPGSGKSTMAQTQFPNHKLVEADQYFIFPNGDYKYDREEIKNAHAWCQAEARRLLFHDHDVVVANTFTKKWEMEVYMDMGYPVEILTATGNWGSVHNVPQHIVDRMRDNFEI